MVAWAVDDVVVDLLQTPKVVLQLFIGLRLLERAEYSHEVLQFKGADLAECAAGRAGFSHGLEFVE